VSRGLADPAPPTRQIPFLDLSRAYRRDRALLQGAVERTLASGRYILGGEVAAFERAFAAYCGTAHAVGVASGTDALHLALRACGIGIGDAVITAPNTAVPTVCAIAMANARPIFVDIDPDTLMLDPNRLRVALKAHPEVKAVIPVHLYGAAADLAPIIAIAREHGLAVIEDAAQAHGTEYSAQKVGSWGEAGCFSFYPTKTLGAYGDAGMVVTNDGEIAGRLRMLRNYGEEAKDRNRMPGVNSRLDELQAALLSAKLPQLPERITTRRRLARLYDDLLAEVPLRLPPDNPPDRHSYHLYVVRSLRRDALRAHLEMHGIGTAIHYPIPVHLQEAYRWLGYRQGDFPGAERACREVLSLPLYPELTDDEVAYVASAIRTFRWEPEI